MIHRLAVPLLASLALTACAAEDESQRADCAGAYDEAQVRARLDAFVTLPENEATLVVTAVNNADHDERIGVSFDGVRVLDVELPGSRGCAHPPVFTFGFAPRAGDVTVEVRAEGATTTEVVPVADSTRRWLLIQTSAELPIQTSVLTEQPLFG